ncbi:hypothetical protein ACJQWK_10440 [Exserohilum turcicum]|uniref:Lytic polysaccharide monooxygenase n=1 Tax=Exserohilum turcicum (strain 28A) TaxID=671987 RepID=R0JUZ9_EXST2|nr:uncharacterized protein SETTUDRAFT_165829 [Exserohilum turcica Et28A]EOA81334.1 hypothetical protein SETTUDRAFT_165829 [Exserohilum turcica Et28A]
MAFRSIFMAATALVATVDAHVKMSMPVPYSVDKVDTSPITKSQYPCKSQNGFTVSQMNQMKVGETNTLKLDGTAVHGGGSCQLSVTLDTEPTANSVFKVIKSMEGGCPAVEGPADSYDFVLPDSIPNGKATFAWTWMSKLAGQAELYMNCAPIEVTGGSDDKTAFEKLPDMLVINIDKSCESVPNSAVQFPNPGSVVQKGNTNDLKPPVGSACGSSGSAPANPSSPAGGAPSPSSPAGGAPSPSSPAGGAPSPSSPAGGAPGPSPPTGGAPAPGASFPAGGAPSPAPTSVAGSKPSASPTSPAVGKPSPPTNGGGVFAPGASSAAPVPSTSTTLVTVTATPTAPAPVAPTPPVGTGSPSAPSSPSGGSGGSGTCSQNGAIVCNGANQFGICNNGNVVWQAVAAGTTCSNGNITKRGYNGRIARPRWSSRRVVN